MRDIGMLIAVGCGGALGAITRYIISQIAHRQFGASFPWGTLLANVIGCFAIGLLLTMADQNWNLSPQLKALMVTGFLGALTTFSTFGWETLSALHAGQFSTAAANVAMNLCLSLLAVWAGAALGTRLS